MRRIRLWWQQPDHYEWLSGYLAARGLTAITRYVLAAILSILAVATLLMLLSPSGPREATPRAVSLTVTACFFAISTGYLVRWPSRVLSQVYSIAGTVAIAASCLVDSDPRAGMLGCAAFIGLTGFIGFFHSARDLALTLSISLATAAVCAIRVAAEGDPALAVSRLIVMTGGILAVPFCGQVLVHWLSVDALKSSTDALTSLRNRRGFYRAAQDLLAAATPGPDRCFTVVMVDLDGFKRVNDTYGHAVGDQILIAVAESLHRASHDDAVLARVGGEEFLVAEIATLPASAHTAERVRAAIAATSWRVTASLGETSIALAEMSEHTREVIDGLIVAADAAMYEAKRAGGNQIRHAFPDQPAPMSERT